MTSYNEVFQLALNLIDDPSLAEWPEEDLTNELNSWLQIAIYNLPQLRNETADRDVFDVSNTNTKGFINTLSDTAKMALAFAIKRAWLAPQISSTTLTWQRFSKKEGYSQKEHLAGLMALDDSIKLELRKLLRDETYVDNDYFD